MIDHLLATFLRYSNIRRSSRKKVHRCVASIKRYDRAIDPWNGKGAEKNIGRCNRARSILPLGR